MSSSTALAQQMMRVLLLWASVVCLAGACAQGSEYNLRANSLRSLSGQTLVEWNPGALADSYLVSNKYKPCGIRAPHTHKTDELVYVVTGSLKIQIALANGTIVTDEVKQGQAQIIPRGLVHILHNPNCKKSSTALLFFNGNAAESVGIPVAQSLFTMSLSPYTLNVAAESTAGAAITEALKYFSINPECAAECLEQQEEKSNN